MPSPGRITSDVSRPTSRAHLSSVNWRWRIVHPRQSWFKTVEVDLWPMNLGLATVKRCVQDRLAWRKLVAMTISSETCFWGVIHIALTHCYEQDSFLLHFSVLFRFNWLILNISRLSFLTFFCSNLPFFVVIATGVDLTEDSIKTFDWPTVKTSYNFGPYYISSWGFFLLSTLYHSLLTSSICYCI